MTVAVQVPVASVTLRVVPAEMLQPVEPLTLNV
jgi:hypothetical protein